MTATKNHAEQAESDALDTLHNFAEDITRQLLEDGKASDDLFNDYPNGDSYHHESHVDKSYRLTEAAELLDRLSEFEGTDDGLWQGLDPREAVSAQAAYTYGNAVMSYWQGFIKRLNERWEELPDEFEGFQEQLDGQDGNSGPFEDWLKERGIHPSQLIEELK